MRTLQVGKHVSHHAARRRFGVRRSIHGLMCVHETAWEEKADRKTGDMRAYAGPRDRRDMGGKSLRLPRLRGTEAVADTSTKCHAVLRRMTYGRLSIVERHPHTKIALQRRTILLRRGGLSPLVA